MNWYKHPDLYGTIWRNRKEHLHTLYESCTKWKLLSLCMKDTLDTFLAIWINKLTWEKLVEEIFASLIRAVESLTLNERECATHELFTSVNSWGSAILEIYKAWISERTSIIIRELWVEIENYWFSWKWIDYGCWDWSIAALLQKKYNISFDWADVSSYLWSTSDITNYEINKYSIDVPGNQYSFWICTNVLHHDDEYERILKELNRIVSGHFVIIESIPDRDLWWSKLDQHLRLFRNDVLFNRLIVWPSINIAVPWYFEYVEDRENIFKKQWRNILKSEDLWYDIPIWKIRHQLFVLSNIN